MDNIQKDLCFIIRSFLSWKEYHRLMNISKDLFHKVKRETLLFPLKAVYTIKFLSDDGWKNELISRVEYPGLQIELSFYKYISTAVTSLPVLISKIGEDLQRLMLSPDYASFSLKMKYAAYEQLDSNPITNVVSLSLSTASSITNFDYIGNIAATNVITIELHPEINVRCLSHLQKLSLENSSIYDVSCLKDATYLCFNNCQGFRSVKGLNHVHTLILKDCDDIKSLKALTNNWRLRTARASYVITH
jgi:hypothetical protein